MTVAAWFSMKLWLRACTVWTDAPRVSPYWWLIASWWPSYMVEVNSRPLENANTALQREGETCQKMPGYNSAAVTNTMWTFRQCNWATGFWSLLASSQVFASSHFLNLFNEVGMCKSSSNCWLWEVHSNDWKVSVYQVCPAAHLLDIPVTFGI